MVSQWFGALQICETPGVVCFEVSTAVEPHRLGLPAHVPPCQPLSACALDFSACIAVVHGEVPH